VSERDRDSNQQLWRLTMTYEEMIKNPELLALFDSVIRDINKNGKETETTMEQLEILTAFANKEEN
jgi:hypothetical protein